MENVINKYDFINTKIKTDIRQSFKPFNNKNYINIIPLSQIEIRNEVIKETSPILFSFKNKVKYSTLINLNEIMFAKLTNHKMEIFKNKILDIKSKIKEINNKIKVIENNNLNLLNIINDNKESRLQNNEDIIQKEKFFFKYYEKITNDISHIEKIINELIFIKNQQKDKINKTKENLLNDLRLTLKEIIESTRNEVNQKLDKFNEYNMKSIDMTEFIEIKNKMKKIKKNIGKINRTQKMLLNLNKLNTNINIIKIKIESGILNQIKFSLKENEKFFVVLSKHMSKISFMRNNLDNNLKQSQKVTKEINDIKLSSLIKNNLSDENNEIKKEISNLNQSQISMNNGLKKLHKNIENFKNLFVILANKQEFHKNIKDMKREIDEIKNKFSKKVSSLEKYNNYYKKLLLKIKKSRKNKIDEIEKGKNIINSRVEEIENLIEINSNRNDSNKKNMMELKQKLVEYNEIFENLKCIKAKIHNQKKELVKLNNKIYDIESSIRNIKLENISYQNYLKKSMNNYIYENKNQVNEMNRQKLLNKNVINNLIIILNNLEKKNIINKELFLNQINSFINKQNEINKRNEEYIKYINKMIRMNKIKNIKKLKACQKSINIIIEKFIVAKESNKNNRMKINNLQEILKKNESKIYNEFDKIKLYLEEKIKANNA